MITADVNEESSENPAEPKADVATVAEAGLPANPEIVTDAIAESSQDTQEDKPAEEELAEGTNVITDELAESLDTITEEPTENLDTITEEPTEGSDAVTEEPSEGSDDITEEFEERPEVHFASGHTTISYVPEEEDTLSVVSILLQEFTGHFLAGLPRILSLEALVVEYRDKFTQTFFKALTKVSNRRFVEIINTYVDYGDPTLIFYCASYELLTSFKDDDDDVDDDDDDGDNKEDSLNE